MINIPPIKPSSAIKSEVIADISKTWKVGQILNATAQKGGEPLSNVIIRLGTYTLEAKTPIALQTGQDVKLLVKSLAENQPGKLPLLSILPPTLKADISAAETNTLAAIKLRQFIAIQQSFSQLQQLSQNLLLATPGTSKLPESLKNLLSNIQNTLQLDTKGLDVTQVKQKILNSGVFLESKLLNLPTNQVKSETGLFNDFKYQLLAIKSELGHFLPANQQTGSQPLTPQQLSQLHTLIKQSASNTSELIDKLNLLLPKSSLIQLTNILSSLKPDLSVAEELQSLAKLLTSTIQQLPQSQQNLQNLVEQLRLRLILLDLGQQVDQSISKLTSLQLQPLSREGDSLVLLLFNLVFKDINEQFDVSFRIQQDNENSEQNKDSWIITLTFNFKTLGKVQSQIHLIEEQVSTVFHTELSSTANKIQQLLPVLEAGLTNAGLNVINLEVENKLFEEKPFVSEGVNLLDENV